MRVGLGSGKYGSLGRIVAAVLVLGSVAFVPRVRGQGTQTEIPLSAGCTLSHDLYTCDKGVFEGVLAGAKSASIETGPTDPVAQRELTKLVASLGKTLVSRGEHADITFLLIPIDPAGVQFNTGDTRLGTLRVFAAKPDSAARGYLVWAENVSGPADMQWFAVVGRLVGQFRGRFHLKG